MSNTNCHLELLALAENGEASKAQISELKILLDEAPSLLAGLRMGPHGNAAIEADASQYYTLMPPRHESPPQYIHWGVNESEGTVASSTGELAADLGTKAKMTLYGLEEQPAPSWVDGPTPQSGTALSFDGKGCYAESEYRGIGGGQIIGSSDLRDGKWHHIGVVMYGGSRTE